MIKTFPDVLLCAHTGKDEPIGFNPCGRFVGLKTVGTDRFSP